MNKINKILYNYYSSLRILRAISTTLSIFHEGITNNVKKLPPGCLSLAKLKKQRLIYRKKKTVSRRCIFMQSK